MDNGFAVPGNSTRSVPRRSAVKAECCLVAGATAAGCAGAAAGLHAFEKREHIPLIARAATAHRSGGPQKYAGAKISRTGLAPLELVRPGARLEKVAGPVGPLPGSGLLISFGSMTTAAAAASSTLGFALGSAFSR